MNDQVDQIGKETRATLASLHWQVRHHEVGTIVSVGDGVGRVRGSPSVHFGELLERPDGLTGLAFDIRTHDVGRVIPRPVGARFGRRRAARHRAGSQRRGGRRIAGPRRRCPWTATGWGTAHSLANIRPVERDAPGVIDRQPVREPMHTGIKVIDALLPLGRGQRELILGDRATGKTSLALDAVLAQRGPTSFASTLPLDYERPMSPKSSRLCAQPARSLKPSSWRPTPIRRRASNTWRPMPPARSANRSCTRAGTC